MSCPNCKVHPRSGGAQRWCRRCHAAYMREYRKSHPLTGEALKRAKARDLARVYRRRGKLVRKPCEICGDEEVQMHHPDYNKPLEVRWVCKDCHMMITLGYVTLE